MITDGAKQCMRAFAEDRSKELTLYVPSSFQKKTREIERYERKTKPTSDAIRVSRARDEIQVVAATSVF